MVEQQLFNREQAAQYLGVSSKTMLRREQSEGGVWSPSYTPDGRPAYHRQQLDLCAAVQLGVLGELSAWEEWLVARDRLGRSVA